MNQFHLLSALLLCFLTQRNLSAKAYISPFNHSDDNVLSHPAEQSSTPNNRLLTEPTASVGGELRQNGLPATQGGRNINTLRSGMTVAGSNSRKLNRIRKSLHPLTSLFSMEMRPAEEDQAIKHHHHYPPPPPPPPAILEPVDLTQNSEENIIRLLSLIASKEGVPIFGPGNNPDLTNLPPAVPLVAPNSDNVNDDDDDDDDGSVIELGYYGSDLSFHPRSEASSRKKPSARQQQQPWTRNHDIDEDNGWIDIYSHKMMRRSERELGRQQERQFTADKISPSGMFHLKGLYPAESRKKSKLVFIPMNDDDDDDDNGRELVMGKIISSRGQKFNMYPTVGQVFSPSQDFQSDLPLIHRRVL